MPRTAGPLRRIARLCSLISIAMITGCLSNVPSRPFYSGHVVPADRAGSALNTPNGSRIDTSHPLAHPVPVRPISLPSSGAGELGLIRTDPNGSPAEGSDEVRTAAAVPDLGHLYGRTAQADDRDRNPIIVIPGVLGTRLVNSQSGQIVWGEFGGNGINPSSPQGARDIALPMSEGIPLAALVDQVKTAGTLDAVDVRLFGIPFQINAYRDLLTTLGVGGYRDDQTKLAPIDYGDQSYNSFQFAYDWRRDNVENARLLHAFILEKKAYVEAKRRERYGAQSQPVRFDIVAHSMGGLIARYYLEYGGADLPPDGSVPPVTWAGTEHVARLVMIATPNAGSLEAVANLVQGEALSRFLPKYEAAILGTMPSLYQLLPRTRQRPMLAEGDRQAVDIFDPRNWAQFRWGLMDPRQQNVLRNLLPEVDDPLQRQKIAYEHLTKCLNRAKSFHAALDVPAKPPAGTSIHLIAGDAHPTTTQFRVDHRGKLTVTAWQPGDGRVSRSSALMDERFSTGVKWTPRLVTPIAWANVNFLFADHLGLTSDPGFSDNILFLLLESPR